MLTDEQAKLIAHHISTWSRPGCAARVLATADEGVLVAVAKFRRSVTVEVTEHQSARDVHEILDYAASLIRDRRPVAPTAGMGRG
jgi:hypothetical protein